MIITQFYCSQELEKNNKAILINIFPFKMKISLKEAKRCLSHACALSARLAER